MGFSGAGGGFSSGQGPGRKTLLLAGVGALALITLWAVLIFSLGGGGEGQGGSATTTGSSSQRAGFEGTSAEQTSGREEQPRQTGAPDGSGEAGGSRTDPGSGGAANAPDDYDPLGRDAEPGALTEADRQRLRLTVSRFVVAAYGYSGDDQDGYYSQVNEVVLAPSLYASPGGEQIERYAALVADNGTQSAAELTDFEVTKTTEKKAAGYAYFTQGSSYADSGELEGELTRHRQRLTLLRDGATWAVESAGEVKLIRESREGTERGIE